MNEFTQPNNRIRNGFLDDKENAKKFFTEKLDRAEALLTDILMVTSGFMNPPDEHDWAHESLLEVFEMFMIRHENFSRSDLAENLQERIFRQTLDYSNKYSDWRKNSFAESGLDDDGEPLPIETEQPPILDLSEHPIKEDECIDLAKHLSSVLNNPQIPHSLKTTIANGISDLADDKSDLINFMDSPEYIAKVLCSGKDEG